MRFRPTIYHVRIIVIESTTAAKHIIKTHRRRLKFFNFSEERFRGKKFYVCTIKPIVRIIHSRNVLFSSDLWRNVISIYYTHYTACYCIHTDVILATSSGILRRQFTVVQYKRVNKLHKNDFYRWLS